MMEYDDLVLGLSLIFSSTVDWRSRRTIYSEMQVTVRGRRTRIEQWAWLSRQTPLF